MDPRLDLLLRRLIAALLCIALAGCGARNGSGGDEVAARARLGPYEVADYADGIPVPPQARFQSPTIWYPRQAAGPCPGVVFMPGYTSDYLHPTRPRDETAVTQWARLLASHGFVVMFVNSAAIATDGPGEKAVALLDAVDALAAESTRAGSPIHGVLQADRIAVMGHSYGAAGALLAADRGSNPRIRAVLALSPVPLGRGPGRFPGVAVPTLIMAGAGDPDYDGFDAEYASLDPAIPRMLAIFRPVTGFSSMHHFARVPLGSHDTDALVARYGLAFLQVYLGGDPSQRHWLAADPRVLRFDYRP